MCVAGEPGTGVEACSGTASASRSADLTARSREGLLLPLGPAAALRVLRSCLPAMPDLEALRACAAAGEAGVAKTSCMSHDTHVDSQKNPEEGNHGCSVQTAYHTAYTQALAEASSAMLSRSRSHVLHPCTEVDLCGCNRDA